MTGVVADRVIVELEAKLDRYTANVRAAEARFTTATRNIERNAKQIERQMAASTGAIGAQFRTLAATFATAFTVQRVAQLADGYTRFTNQLKVAGVEGGRLGRVQNELFGIAQKYGVELESLGTLYSRGSQASKELGASNAELMKFTNGVAAALKIQGGAASETRGALLQLSQALGSPIVRAEEFNSINEGARPILRAVAAGIDRFGGSVAKLRNEVIKGKVTSQEFFQGFLAGSADLEAKAAKANLTIGASFTILNNALGKYVGETDASLSATQRISQALITLSENLDTVIKALAVIVTLLGARYIAAAVAAARTTGIVSTALFALQARAIGAATSMEALALAGATAGRSLLAVFGGPVGLAVVALAAGLYYLSEQHDAATAASEKQTQALAASEGVLGKAEDAANALATATGKARAEALAHAEALRQETIQLIQNAKAAVLAAKAKAQASVADMQLNAERRRISANDPRMIPALGTPQENADRVKQANNDLKAATATLTNYTKALEELNAGISGPPAVAPVAPPGKKKKAKKGPKGTDPDEIARRFADDMARGALDYEQAMAEVAGTVYDRISTEKHAIRIEAEINARAIKADKDLSASQKEQLLLLNEQVAQARVDAVDAAERRQMAEDAVELAAADIANKTDLIDAQLQLANTTAERRDLELKLLDLQEQEERIRLEAIAANETLRDAVREAARQRLAELGSIYGARREGVDKRNQGPGADYLDQLNAKDLNEQLEQIKVDGLKGLEEQLTDTIAKVVELGGVFGQVANQIIKDLIRIAVQKAIIGPLANALFGGGEGLGGLLGGLFGGSSGGISESGAIPTGLVGPRASGGHVQAGKLYRVNENPGGVEGFMPSQSGKIIPLGQMPTGDRGGGVTVLQHFTLDARYGITTPELLRHVNRIAASHAAAAGKGAYDASRKSLAANFSSMQKLGTVK